MLKIEVPWEEGTALRRWANFEDPAPEEGEVIKRLLSKRGSQQGTEAPPPRSRIREGGPPS